MSETVMEYMAKFGLDTTELSDGLTGAAISFDALAMEAEIALQSIEKALKAHLPERHQKLLPKNYIE